MVTVTKKYSEACKMFPDFKGKKPLDVYVKMSQKGYEWNSFETRWESEADKEELPVVNINIKCSTQLIDDAIEQITSLLKAADLEILNTPRAYPAKERDSKNNLIQSKTHSTAYIQYRFPEIMEDEIELTEDEE